MSSRVEKIIDDILRVEGDAYTNYPNDRGGPTKYGITRKTLSHARGREVSPDDVAALTAPEARSIYRDIYIVQPGFTQVLAISEIVGVECVDTGVNCGTLRAAKWLQQSLNAFNRSYRSVPDYAELVVDGKIGARTITALSDYFAVRGKARGEPVLKRALDTYQGAHYLALAAASDTQEQFTFGWFLHRIG